MQLRLIHGVAGAVALAMGLGCLVTEPNSTIPQGLNTITVLVHEGRAYPIYQFTCADVEPAAEPSEACPDGAGCDGRHYHGTAISLGLAQTTGIADVAFSMVTTSDPAPCLCGWGKVGEADVRTLTVFASDIDEFFSSVAPPALDGMTLAEAISVDPCGS